jgi:ATP-dependent exoDNAse (exonuclease V) beta subunit
MKATLEFNLPEDQTEYLAAVHATPMFGVVDNLLEAIRLKLNHEAGEFATFRNDDGMQCRGCDATLEQVRKVLCQIREEAGIPWDL